MRMRTRTGWTLFGLALAGLSFGASCKLTRSEAEQWRFEATKATEKGDWVAAGDLWLRVHVAAEGTDLVAARELALALARRGDAEGSKKVIDSALETFPGNAELLGQRAELAIATATPREAAMAYQEWLQVEPNNASGWRTLGELRLQDGDLGGATVALRQAASFPPEDPQLLMLVADISERAGDTMVALNARMRAIQSGVESIELYEGAGRLAAQRVLSGEEPGLAALAEEWLLHATELNPQSVESFWLLGRLDRKRHRSLEAIERLRRAVELEPTHLDALYELAELYAEEQRPDQAREFAERALELDPPKAQRLRLAELAGRPPEEMPLESEEAPEETVESLESVENS